MLIFCKYCNNQFFRKIKALDENVNYFCSRSCAVSHNNVGKQRNKPKDRTCNSCSSTYVFSSAWRSRYCKECIEERKEIADIKYKSTINKICVDCNLSFEYSVGFNSYRRCSVCFSKKKEIKLFKYDAYINMTLDEFHSRDSVKNKHPSWKNAHIRYHARRKHLSISSKPCANCGYSKHVEIAHIKPVSSFLPTATLGEVNSIDNLIQLCRNCHWEFDHNLLTLEQIQTEL